MKAATGRIIASYTFEDKGTIEIWCGSGIDTAVALDIVTTLIDLKRKELGKRGPVPLKATG